MTETDVPYEVKWSSELGRYLVAVRDILPREIIIREDPLISGPSDRGPKEFPVCLGCSDIMYSDPLHRCRKCRWPVCNDDCEEMPSHASNECQIFQRNRVSYPPPNCWPIISKSIFILRCLLLKSSKPSEWERLMNMSDNKNIRSGKPNCINADKKILENFAKFFPGKSFRVLSNSSESSSSLSLASEDEGFSDEEVIRISGIIDVNAHAFPLRVNGRSTATYVCNLYSKTSLMAHSCTPNVSWTGDKSLSSLTLTVRANVPISKGEMISVAYDEGQLLVSTLKRLVPNEINGMFVCKCERCRDPTELQTYLGALKCPSCTKGYLLPIDPIESFSSWKCDNGIQDHNNRPGVGRKNDDHVLLRNNCDQDDDDDDDDDNDGNGGNGVTHCNLILDDESVLEIMQDAELTCGYSKMDLATDPPPSSSSSSSPEEDEEGRQEDLDETLELLKEFVKDYAGSVLHPNHYILQEVNVRILKREYAKGLKSLSDVDLVQYLERCERLLWVSNVLTPGFCEYRAFLQYHFSQGLLSLERRKARRRMMMKKKKGGKPMMKQIQRRHRSGGCNSRREQELELNVAAAVGDDAGESNNEATSSTKLVPPHSSQNDGDNSNKNNNDDVDDGVGGSNKGGACGDSDDDDDDDESICGETMKDCSPTFSFEDTAYGNSRQNYERIRDMLLFLLTFFKEINPSHKLLEPISDTLMETERKLKVLRRRRESSLK